jgi:hypothetical protein
MKIVKQGNTDDGRAFELVFKCRGKKSCGLLLRSVGHSRAEATHRLTVYLKRLRAAHAAKKEETGGNV